GPGQSQGSREGESLRDAQGRCEAQGRGEAQGLREAQGRKPGQGVVMFGRPRNRRRPTERALKAPATNWRAVGLTLATVAGVAALASAVSWAFDQPIETVAVTGRFQRVAPGDVE